MTTLGSRAPIAEGTAHTAGGGQRVRPAEIALLLAAPLIVFFVLDVRVMAPLDMIDPAFYTAYAQHGSELMQRYGPIIDGGLTNYFWVRFGFILPARLCYWLFGPVAGFYVFRYLLALVAIVPAYLLFRRLYNRWAGSTVVLVILSSPVVLLAWGTDYPDSSGVSYVIAAMACLVMPSATRRRRLLWVTASGVLFTLAVHSQVVAIPLVVGAVAAYLAVHWRQPMRVTAVEVGLLAGAFLVVTAGFALVAQWWLGQANIILPTLKAGRRLRGPGEIENWHSRSGRWALYTPYVLVPLAVAGGWAAAQLRGWREAPPSELAVAVGFGLQLGSYYGLQFVAGRTATLEYHLYSSMLWAGLCLTLAFVLVRLLRPLLLGPTPWVAPLLVLTVPFVYRLFRPTFEFDNLPLGLLLALGAVLLVLPLWRGAVLAPAGAALATGVMVTLLVLTVAVPPEPGEVPGATGLPKGQYAAMLGGDGSRDLDVFRVATKLHSLVPPPRGDADDLLMWFPPDQWNTLNMATAQFLWVVNSLSADMPRLSEEDRQTLDRRRPGTLVLLSVNPLDLPQGVRALEEGGYQPGELRAATLRSGPIGVHVRVVALGRFA